MRTKENIKVGGLFSFFRSLFIFYISSYSMFSFFAFINFSFLSLWKTNHHIRRKENSKTELFPIHILRIFKECAFHWHETIWILIFLWRVKIYTAKEKEWWWSGGIEQSMVIYSLRGFLILTHSLTRIFIGITFLC